MGCPIYSKGTVTKLVGYGFSRLSSSRVLFGSVRTQNSQIPVGCRLFRVPIPSLIQTLIRTSRGESGQVRMGQNRSTRVWTSQDRSG